MTFQVLTFGETMVRLTPPANLRLEQSASVEIHVGGSESNTAVGLSRLGIKTAWFSRITDNPLGQHIVNTIRGQGVDTSSVVWTQGDRVGLYFMERGCQGRPSQVFYDRCHSAMSRLTTQDLPVVILSQGIELLHATGITLGISDSAREAAMEAIRIAKRAGSLISFDVNYRKKLWPPEAAAEACSLAIELSDIVFMPIRDANMLFGVHSQAPKRALQELHHRFSTTTFVLTLGSQGATAMDAGGGLYSVAPVPCEPIERLGGGDAFSAGFLASYVVDRDTKTALTLAAAAASAKYTIPGDLPLFDNDHVRSLARDGSVAQDIIR